MSFLKFVSIIIPCRNEGKFIGMCLDSIIANDYPKDLMEVLVVDGMSIDGTRDILHKYAGQYPFIKFLDNPKQITPAALNIGIAAAKGEIIMRMDAHTTYEKDYISKCVLALDEQKADNVGGIWKTIPRDNTRVGMAIVSSLSHPFGTGNAYYRLQSSKQPRQVDTVPFFCCRRKVFESLGLFNESLARGQDMEFSLRLKRAGYRTVLIPNIISCYYARSDMKSFWKHNFQNGVWAILPFLYSDVVPVALRHLVPMGFVLALIVTLLTAVLWPPGVWLFSALAGSYLLACLSASFHVAWRERDVRLAFLMPMVFGSLHLGYGFGSVWGLMKALVYWVTGKTVRRDSSEGL